MKVFLVIAVGIDPIILTEYCKISTFEPKIITSV